MERERAREGGETDGVRTKKGGKEGETKGKQACFCFFSPIDLYAFSALCVSAVSRTDPFKRAVRMGRFLKALFLMAVSSAGPFICYFDYERTISLWTDSRCRWYSGGLQMHPHTQTHTQTLRHMHAGSAIKEALAGKQQFVIVCMVCVVRSF